MKDKINGYGKIQLSDAINVKSHAYYPTINNF